MSDLRTFAERIERLHEEKRSIEDDIKEVYAELASAGYDKKAMREAIKRRSKDPQELGEFESIVDLYLNEINGSSRTYARDARDAREAETSDAGRASGLSGNADGKGPDLTTRETEHVDRSAGARPLKADGADGHDGITQSALNRHNFEQPSGAGTGSVVRTGAPISRPVEIDLTIPASLDRRVKKPEAA